MNELINITLNDNHETVVSINTFEQLYLYVSKMKVQADISELKKLKEFVRGFYFSDEINQVVEARLNEKADRLKLNDLDLEVISKRLEKIT